MMVVIWVTTMANTAMIVTTIITGILFNMIDMVKTVEIILQAVLSVFIDTTFLFGMSILEGKGPTASLENLKDKYNF